MSDTLTKDQQYAINLRDKHLLVAAAAGSGKTFVLVERIIGRILDEKNPIDVDELLVMTFTRAAAAEMRERIQAAIEAKLSNAKDDKALKSRLKEQLSSLDIASINTIDGFCLSIIREHCDKTKLDPSFRVADDTQVKLIEQDVMNKLLIDAYTQLEGDTSGEKIEGIDNFIELVDSYAEGREDTKITELISKVHKFAQSMPWPSDWYEKTLLDMQDNNIDSKSVLGSDWINYITDNILMVLKDIENKIEVALDIIRSEGGPIYYEPNFIEELDYVKVVRKCSDFLSISKMLGNLCEFKRLSSKKAPEVDPDLKEQAKNIRDEYKDILKDLSLKYGAADIDSIVEDEKKSSAFLRTLIYISYEYSKRLEVAKRKKNIVDFGDIEHIALSILWDKNETGEYVKSDIAKSYAKQFKEIYIDEYQDSNDVQEELIKAIDPGSVFMVGDVKQSIYAFRRAKPELFNSKYITYKKYTGSETDNNLRIDLSKNFRSRDKVLESVNSIFERIMKPELGGIDYDEAARLNPGAAFASYEDTESFRKPDKAQVLLCDVKNKDTDDDKKQLEARMIAAKIKELTDPNNGCLVWDNNEKKYRVARYSDIAILIRSQSGYADTFVDELTKQGIPAYAATQSGYFDTVEVRGILDLLSIIDNPIQDIPLASVLTSSIIGMDDTELSILIAEYRKTKNDKKVQRLYEICKNADSLNIDEKTKSKIRAMLDMLDRYSYLSKTMKLAELIENIYVETGYLEYQSALPAGEIRRENLRMLVAKAEAYESIGYRGLSAFNRYIENLKKYNMDMGEAQILGEYDNTVRIMTIHKSKGLEFPICFVSAVDKRFNKSDVTGSILIDDKLGIACNVVDIEAGIKYNTLKRAVIARHMIDEQLGEELRVLYVALTRAKEQLIITGTIKDIDKVSFIDGASGMPYFTAIEKANSYFDFLKLTPIGDKTLFDMHIYNAEDLICDEEQLQSKALEYKDKLEGIEGIRDDSLIELINYNYPHASDINLHTKLTVSELKELGQNVDEEKSYNIEYTKENKRPAGKKTGGAAKGTLYHRLLEKIDYSKVTDEKSFDLYLKELSDAGIISDGDKELIDKRDFTCWLSSKLGGNAAAAYKEGRLKREAEYIMSIPADELGFDGSESPILIQGIIDAYIEDDEGIVLIDYKTDRVKAESELVERYKTQLDYYEKALIAMKKKPVKSRIIWSFYLGKAVPC